MKKLLPSALMLSAVLTFPVNAEQETNWFAAAAVGNSDANVGFLDDDTGFKVAGGYSFSENWAVSLEYVDLGELDVDASALGFFGVNSSLEADGFNLSVIGILPVNDSFDLFAKVGAFNWDIEAKASSGGFSASEDEDGTDISWGLGAAYNFSDNFSVTAEFQRFDIDEDEIDLISGGVIFRF